MPINANHKQLIVDLLKIKDFERLDAVLYAVIHDYKLSDLTAVGANPHQLTDSEIAEIFSAVVF